MRLKGENRPVAPDASIRLSMRRAYQPLTAFNCCRCGQCFNPDDANKINMTGLSELLQEGVAGLTLAIPLCDLKEFADYIVAKTKEELLPTLKAADEDPLIPRLEVMRMLGVCANTLRNWRKSKYLEAVHVGAKVFYRTSAVNKVLDEYGKERV